MFTLDKSSSTPLFLQVKAGIMAQIAANSYSNDRRLPSEADFAETLGLSSLTVRRAMVVLAQQGLLRRIPGRGTFVVTNIGMPTPRRISLLLPRDIPHDLSSRYAMHVISGIYNAIQPATLVLRTMSTDTADLLDCHGMVVLWMNDAREIRRLAASNTPVVGYECAVDPVLPAFDNISHANADGFRVATSALINLGHTDIGCVLHTNSISAEHRVGFERALAEQGLQTRPERVVTLMNTSEAGYALGRRLLADLGKAPTALLCSDEALAVGILAAAQELGHQVPDTLSIIGFGDFGTFTTPPLSSVRLDIASSGRIAAHMLQERLGCPAMHPRSVILPTEFIRRASCGPPRRSH